MQFKPDGTLLDRVVRAVKEVGAFQLAEFRKQAPGSGSEKVLREFVSHIDIESEKTLRIALQTLVSDTGFYGEETVQETADALLWVVDPVDGTTNYLSGLSQWSISVALTADKKPVLGVVYQPYTGELFTALDGDGVRFNGRKLTPATPMELNRALVGTGFPYRSPDTENAFFACAADVLHASRGIRRLGSAALDLAYVAAGFLQGFWEVDLQPYDVAAAVLFLREMGCPVTDFTGEPYDLFRSRTLVAGLPGVHEALRLIIAGHYEK